MTWRSLGDSNPCFRRERAFQLSNWSMRSTVVSLTN